MADIYKFCGKRKAQIDPPRFVLRTVGVNEGENIRHPTMAAVMKCRNKSTCTKSTFGYIVDETNPKGGWS